MYFKVKLVSYLTLVCIKNKKQRTKYLNDIKTSQASDLAALIKEVALKPECDNYLKAISNAALKEIAAKTFNLDYLDDAIETLDSFKEKLKDEDLTKIVNAVCSKITDLNFDSFDVKNVIEACAKLNLSTDNITKLVDSACEKMPDKDTMNQMINTIFAFHLFTKFLFIYGDIKQYRRNRTLSKSLVN